MAPAERGSGSAALRLLLVGTLLVLAGPPAPSAPLPDAAPECAAGEYRQLDFWLGDWDVYDVGASTPVARAHVTRLLEGCVVHEVYESQRTRGESFSIFDRSRGVWHQIWVTNRGRLLQVEGVPRDGRLTLTGTYLDGHGRRTDIRAFWWAVPEGVREQAETSGDHGHTWQPEFNLIFRPHRE